MMAADADWIVLTETKDYSRLLYTNPVCFLTTDTNVMTISWLTATNNTGGLVCSVNRRRHSASRILEQRSFVLSVPVQGMEELVLSVGSCSGSRGSKFKEDQSHGSQASDGGDAEDCTPQSKRQRKKMLQQGLGVPGLVKEPFKDDIFAIRGTVAQMKCRVDQILDTVDADHHLLVAQVVSARVKTTYWDVDKKLFRPSTGAPPYLTFFGSQTFGYVVPSIPPQESNTDEGVKD